MLKQSQLIRFTTMMNTISLLTGYWHGQTKAKSLPISRYDDIAHQRPVFART